MKPENSVEALSAWKEKYAVSSESKLDAWKEKYNADAVAKANAENNARLLAANAQNPRQATLKDLTVGSFTRGVENAKYGQELFKQMNGKKNKAGEYEKKLSADEYNFAPKGIIGEAVSGAAGLLGQQYRQFTDPETLAYAAAAATMASIAGKAGPQAIVPEEVVTVPVAAGLGFKAGSAKSNMEIEAGHAYKEMIDLGISHDTARAIAVGVGGANAALEAVQLDELAKSLKVLDKSGADKGVMDIIKKEILRRSGDVAKETAQEVAQEGVTIAGAQLGSKRELGKWAYSKEEVGERLGDTAKSSALSFGLLNVPSGVKNVVSGKKASSNASVAAQDAQGAAQTSGEGNLAQAAQEAKKAESNAAYGPNYDVLEAAAIRHEGANFRNLIAGIDTSVSDFFDKWRNGRKSQNGDKLEKLYLGKMNADTLEKVSSILGYNVSRRDVVLTNDNVKHILDKHGGDDVNSGNLPLAQWVFDALPEVVANPDNIEAGKISVKGKDVGKQGVKISKKMPNGTVVTIQFDNKGRETIEIKTMYAKKEDTPSVPNATAAAEPVTVRPKRPEPVSSNSDNTIPQQSEFVKNENDGLGSARGGFDPFSAAENKYGVLPSGENAVRPDDVPVSTNGKDRVSQSVVTMKGAEATPESFIGMAEDATMRGEFSFIPITNDETAQSAAAAIASKGWEASRAEWTADVKAGKTSPDITAKGAILFNNAVNSDDHRAALDIFRLYQQSVRNSARALQAARILKTLTPESRLYMIERSAQDMMDKMSGGEDIAISKELEDAYLNAATEKERDAVVERMQQYVADRIPATLMDKFTALRYVNMLGNFKTQGRNLLGNLTMTINTRIKDAQGAIIERLFNAFASDKSKVERTKALSVPRPLYKAARADFESVKSAAMGQGKYNESNVSGDFAQGVQDKRRIFATTPLEMYRTITNWSMEQGDVVFSRANYAHALGGYLKAHGVTAQQFSDTAWQKRNAKFLDKARQYAIAQAQEATFRDNNAVSNYLSSAMRGKNTPKAVKVLGEGLAPFRKTPANVMVRAEEYSPLGIINTAVKAAKKAKGDANISGADIIDSLAKSMTGIELMVLGVALRGMGLIRGGEDEDEKQASFDALQGHQAYSLELPDGFSYTLEALSPPAIAMFMGAQLRDAMDDGAVGWRDIEKAMMSITEPMMEMSMMQSANDLLGNIKYSDNSVAQLGAKLAVGYLTQGMTNSLLGQTERTFEDVRQSTYVDKNKDIPDWLQRELGKASAKTPGIDFNQIPYIDEWGREEENGSLGARAFENLFSPGYISRVDTSVVEKELQRLKDATGDSAVLPTRAAKYITSDKKRIDFTGDQYVKYAKTLGSTRREVLSDLVSRDGYKALDEESKAKMVGKVYDYASECAKASITNKPLDGKALQLKNAEKVGIKAADWLLMYDEMDASGNGTVSQEEARNYLDGKKVSNDYGNDVWFTIDPTWKKKYRH